MKKMLIITAVLMILGLSASAEARGRGCDGPLAGILNKCIGNEEIVQSRAIVGAKIDAPYLIRFTKDWTLGLEGGKELYSDPFMDRGYWVEDDEGYFGYVKVTYTGTLFSFAKK